MCGIVAVVAGPARRPPPARSDIDLAFGLAHQHLSALGGSTPAAQAEALGAAATALAELDVALRGVPGLACLAAHPAAEALKSGTDHVGAMIREFEEALDEHDLGAGAGGDLEARNAALVALRDANWALGQDRWQAARDVLAMAGALGAGTGPEVLGVLWAVHVALRSLDRLEVRGRDSAGAHLMLAGPGLAGLTRSLAVPDGPDPVFRSRSARVAGGCLSLVHKVAAEIGELGDNVAALRRSISSDPVLAAALQGSGVSVTVVAHTRWASVGLISEANAHPLNSDEPGRAPGPYVIGALNGDVDNYARLVASEAVAVPAEVTTDAKLVPVLVSRQMAAGRLPAEAMRLAATMMEGSMGVAANSAASPGEVLLAVRGSGQSLNIGLAEDAFVVASEPYGLVEEASRYLRMDGSGGGQVVVCRQDGAGTLAGMSRWSYGGKELPFSPGELKTAEITTRDVDRRGFRHYLLKEISESPLSVRKTLRGRLVPGENGDLMAALGDDAIPVPLRQAVAQGAVHDVFVIGQGTAAVAGQAVAAAISAALPRASVKAMPATELSGWGTKGAGLDDDMSGTLVVAVSQSGTTTDTNRAVDLVHARGAHVVAIVNRRNSDLAHKSDGVIYTSDGRDVEMSVASTKAFYSQVAAGYLLASGLAAAAGAPRGSGEVLSALHELPVAMRKVLDLRPQISRVAAAAAPPRRSWAVVGSGPDRVAAAEVRIKLSELCYKTIGTDTTEDKKHIDLSSEPLVVVCAASAAGANADDIAKEVEIFRAHKAAVVVVATEGEEAFSALAQGAAGVDVVRVPRCHPRLAFVLAAMVGHLFGYEAALAIDAQARPLREARALLEAGLADGDVAAERLAGPLGTALAPALSGLRAGAYDGHLNASTAARLGTMLRFATRASAVEDYEAETGRAGTPVAIAADLLGALSVAIDELTRPVDAIKHQAKTVTVGTSRSEQALFGASLVLAARAAGAPLEALGYRALRTLAALGPAVEEVLGHTRYRVVTGPGGLAGATVGILDRAGIAVGIPSRTETDNTLRGTKHRVAQTREVTVFRGLHDGRTGIMVPEAKDGQVTGITLLHARFAGRLGPAAARSVLEGYQGRYGALVDAVTEAQPELDDAVLAQLDVVDLLTQPVALLATHWAGPGPALSGGAR